MTISRSPVKTSPRKTKSEVERFKLLSATFIKGAVQTSELLTHDTFEIALLGRSNVGKSTLVNRLTNIRKLAKTSKMAGRTQEINSFKIEASFDKKKIGFYLCDLPGFGFARIGGEKKSTLEKTLKSYLTERECLAVVGLLIDCRRGPERDELYLRDLIFSSGATVLPILTKADKLSNNEMKNQKVKIAKLLQLEEGDLITSGTKTPVSDLWIRLLEVV